MLLRDSKGSMNVPFLVLSPSETVSVLFPFLLPEEERAVLFQMLDITMRESLAATRISGQLT